MRVLIACEGGADLGFGHLSRCLALAQAFVAAGHVVRFAVAGDESARTRLPNADAEWYDWRRDEARLFAQLAAAEAVVVDSYHAPAALLAAVSARSRAAVFLDDYRRLDYPPGVVVNWSVAAADLGYPERSGVRYLLGPAYVALRRAFWEVAPRPLRPEVQEALVSFGGDDGRRLTVPALDLLCRRFPDWRKTVVVGPACRDGQAIAAAADGRTRMLHALDEQEMARAMAAADVAVTSGGQTLFELARVGLPAVVTAVADNQRLNVRGWAAAGAVEDAGSWDEPGWAARVSGALERLRDDGRRREAARAGRQQVPGNGAGRIIEVVAERVQNQGGPRG